MSAFALGFCKPDDTYSARLTNMIMSSASLMVLLRILNINMDWQRLAKRPRFVSHTVKIQWIIGDDNKKGRVAVTGAEYVDWCVVHVHVCKQFASLKFGIGYYNSQRLRSDEVEACKIHSRKDLQVDKRC